MAVPIPPVTSVIAPVLSVTPPQSGITGTGITYQQFLQSLGTYNYGAEFFYLQAPTYPEVGQPVFYNRFTADGNSVSTYLPFAVDPYQSQPAIFYEVEKDQIVFTGLTTFQFNVKSGSTYYFKFFATILFVGNTAQTSWHDYMGVTAFDQLEQEEGVRFFDDYCNYLIDEA